MVFEWATALEGHRTGDNGKGLGRPSCGVFGESVSEPFNLTLICENE